MALSADFTVSNRVGDGILNTTFNDASSGSIVSRKWIFGDGTVVDGNLTSVNHIYWFPGKYSITLVVDNGTDIVSTTKEEYIVVNEVYIEPNFIIIQSMDAGTGDYWKFYLDSNLHLVYETKDVIYRTDIAIADIREWSLVEFHLDKKEMYVGSLDQYRTKVQNAAISNSSPIAVSETRVDIVPESQMKIDELKIWAIEKDLSEYFSSTRGKAGFLDNQ